MRTAYTGLHTNIYFSRLSRLLDSTTANRLLHFVSFRSVLFLVVAPFVRSTLQPNTIWFLFKQQQNQSKLLLTRRCSFAWRFYTWKNTVLCWTISSLNVGVSLEFESLSVNDSVKVRFAIISILNHFFLARRIEWNYTFLTIGRSFVRCPLSVDEFNQMNAKWRF